MGEVIADRFTRSEVKSVLLGVVVTSAKREMYYTPKAIAGMLAEDGSTPHANGHHLATSCLQNFERQSVVSLSVPRVLASDSNQLKHCVATHANRHHSSNILRASNRKTERDEQDAIGERVGTASDRFQLQPAEAHACK